MGKLINSTLRQSFHSERYDCNPIHRNNSTPCILPSTALHHDTGWLIFSLDICSHSRYYHVFLCLTNAEIWLGGNVFYLILARAKSVYISIRGSIQTCQSMRSSHKQRISEADLTRWSVHTISSQLIRHMPKHLSVMAPSLAPS